MKRRMSRFVLAFLVACATAAVADARRRPRHDEPGGFDYYLLSLSVAPSFCALSPANAAKQECRTLTPDDVRRTPLTVHGLWPNRAFLSVNRQPMDCPGPNAGTFPPELARYMPGGPGLASYEWHKHGTCSGLSPDVYFDTLVQLARRANEQIGPLLTEVGKPGDRIRVTDLLSAVAARDPGLADAIVVDCRFPRGASGPDQALIAEIRITLSRSFTPVPASSVGLGQNSGCPAGAGLLPAHWR